MPQRPHLSSFFFFNDTATTEIYTLSLHDALPISVGTFTGEPFIGIEPTGRRIELRGVDVMEIEDRKSTRLNSSHSQISYAVFCLKKKKNTINMETFKGYYSIIAEI